MTLISDLSETIKINLAKNKLDSRKLDNNIKNPLEQWGIIKIMNDIKNNKELNKYYSNKTLDREGINYYKLFKFKQLINYVLQNSPYYQQLYKENGIDASLINSYEDLEKIPLTEQKQLAYNHYHFLCVPRKHIVREFTSSGTTNLFKKIAYTQDELLEIVDSVIAGLKMVGLNNKTDTLQIMYPTITATWDPGLVLSKACTLAGFKSVIEDSLDVNIQIETMKKAGTTFIIGTSSFIHSLSKQIENKSDIRNIGIKRIICSSEPLSENMRKEIESIWNCKVLRQWGMTEIGLANSIECTEQNGFHLNNPDFLVEIINPKTNKQLPLNEEGELVVTTLRRRCMPLIRYRTKDITSIIDEPCKCGACLDQRTTDIKRLY